ncbi:protocatechuate 3,4-dioxygenase subunit alpha [Amnibacterium kyonggiense]|uniref:Protocatechuate 3,4-dioxygenase alpha subunit n=1 Tax=Amnibacterium kyonggiense TaxID=595671 RepID=A0A4R7FCH8_9MICO|nr:protocatechuate 3,4-dioxygenase subunit alpha [Amnibacterium kyonggiense]TDS74457.1 protocatechuate 3,4-dioxygenase alpha subunit [Amnibacterium kyonggiense]
MTSDLGQTPSQTVGPFFGYALPFAGGPQLVAPSRADAVVLHGVVLDGDGLPVPDALLELWQADADGALVQRAGSRARELGRFTGFGRSAVDVDGHYEFATVLPGAVAPSTTGWALITVFARGLLHHLFTRAYFLDADAALPADPLLDRVDPARRETLIARADGPGSYRFDIRLQGEGETVFLEYADRA